MSTNFVNQVPFLRASRSFPSEPQELSVELSKSYIDIANCVNARSIGLFSKGRPSITGNQWFITSKKQQTIRQVYTFTAAGSFAHGINVSNIGGFVSISGTVKDASGNWYPLPLVDTVAASQISVAVTSTNIVITAGGSAPTISSGYVILEWLSIG